MLLQFCIVFLIIPQLSNSKLFILEAGKANAPNVPPPISRTEPALLRLHLNASLVRGKLDPTNDYDFWTFDGQVPGPLIRARIGDQLEVTLTNSENTGVSHNIDFHTVSGPGGGTPVLTADPGQSVTATFHLLYPGLFIYHCAVEPAPYHVVNGLYGLILVEPSDGLAKVDREFYIVRSEFYTHLDNGSLLKPSYGDALDEKPSHVVFNGRAGSLIENPLNIKTNERVRIFFGNAGPNQVASFHIIGTIFDKVYREGDLISPPGRGIQTTLVPAGGSTVVEFTSPVPGTYTIVDHSLFRLLKGAVGYVKAEGPARLDIYCPSKLGENVSCIENVKLGLEEYIEKDAITTSKTQKNGILQKSCSVIKIVLFSCIGYVFILFYF